MVWENKSGTQKSTNHSPELAPSCEYSWFWRGCPVRCTRGCQRWRPGRYKTSSPRTRGGGSLDSRHGAKDAAEAGWFQTYRITNTTTKTILSLSLSHPSIKMVVVHGKKTDRAEYLSKLSLSTSRPSITSTAANVWRRAGPNLSLKVGLPWTMADSSPWIPLQ